VCRELGIGIVPYSPLGRGMLTGTMTSAADLAINDFRRGLPRFQDEAFAANQGLVAEVQAVADARGATPAQVALAWVLAQGDDVVPIPGTKRVRYLEDNVGAVAVELDDADRARLDALRATGDRFGDMAWVNRSTPPTL
jgi:aryl-alcohol dehydrogenase-like predicted oxidoreductase